MEDGGGKPQKAKNVDYTNRAIMKNNKHLFTGFIVFVILSIFLSCQDRTKDIEVVKPDTLIRVSDMKEILFDVFIAEAAIYKKQIEGADLMHYTLLYYGNIFKQHNIDRHILKSSLTYYIKTKEIENIYRDVITMLREHEIALEEIKSKNLSDLEKDLNQELK